MDDNNYLIVEAISCQCRTAIADAWICDAYCWRCLGKGAILVVQFPTGDMKVAGSEVWMGDEVVKVESLYPDESWIYYFDRPPEGIASWARDVHRGRVGTEVDAAPALGPTPCPANWGADTETEEVSPPKKLNRWRLIEIPTEEELEE